MMTMSEEINDLKNLPLAHFHLWEEEILQFEEILQRNAAARCPPKSLAKEIMPVKLEASNNDNDVRTSSIARSGPSPPPVSTYNKNDAKKRPVFYDIGKFLFIRKLSRPQGQKYFFGETIVNDLIRRENRKM